MTTRSRQRISCREQRGQCRRSDQWRFCSRFSLYKKCLSSTSVSCSGFTIQSYHLLIMSRHSEELVNSFANDSLQLRVLTGLGPNNNVLDSTFACSTNQEKEDKSAAVWCADSSYKPYTFWVIRDGNEDEDETEQSRNFRIGFSRMWGEIMKLWRVCIFYVRIDKGFHQCFASLRCANLGAAPIPAVQDVQY